MHRLWILLPLFFIIYEINGSEVEDYPIESPQIANSQVVEEYDQDDEDFNQFIRMEGDIIVKKSRGSSTALHSALSESSKRWKNGEVPYRRGRLLDNNPFKSTILKEAMDEISRRTCVKFIPNVDNRTDYILFKAPPGSLCSSEVGRQGGRQFVVLSDQCFTRATVQHELMHALGFVHEQNRSDRDEWVEIKWDHIKEGEQGEPKKYWSDFTKRSHEELALLETGYSYESIMHYGKYAFSKDEKNLPTVVAKKSGGDKMGNRQYLTDIDVLRINIIYKCKDHLKTTPKIKTLPPAPPTWTPSPPTRPPPPPPTRPPAPPPTRPPPPPPTRPPAPPPTRPPAPPKPEPLWRVIKTLDIRGYGEYSPNEITYTHNGNSFSVTGAQNRNGHQKSFAASFTTPVAYSEVKVNLENGQLIFLAPDYANQRARHQIPPPPPSKPKKEWRAVHIVNISPGYSAHDIKGNRNGNYISFKGEKNENGSHRSFSGMFTTPVNYSDMMHLVQNNQLIFVAPEHEVADKNGQVFTFQ